MKRFSIRKVLMFLGAAGIVTLLVYAFLPKPIAVDVVQVERGELVVTIEEDGKTRIKKWSTGLVNGTTYRKEPFRYVVTAPLSGLVRQILLEPGDDVEAGKIVATIEASLPELLDQRTLSEAKEQKNKAEAAFEQAKAKKQSAKQAYDLDKSIYLRTINLRAQDATSQEELDTAEGNMQIKHEEFKVATIGVKVAEHQLKMAKATLAHVQSAGTAKATERIFQLTAPLTGKVLKVHKEFRGPVSAGNDLIEIGDTRELDMVIDVLSEDAVKIKPGAKVFIDQWGGDKELIGRVRLVEPGAFLKISALGVEEQRVNVIVDFDEQENAKRDPKGLHHSLGDAYRIQARIVIWQDQNVVKVPAGALHRHGQQWSVFVVEDGQAVRRHVQVGQSNGLWTHIKSGLDVGTPVILHPSDQVKDGVQVYAR
ncbi:MAG: efflux RND transporter periplasmic adaptor subunit [Gemmataceae bacterium]